MEAILDTVEAIVSYPRKLIATYASWDELKQFIFSNMVVYFGLLLISMGLDPLINSFSLEVHPYVFGKYQIFASLFFLTQFWRHFSAWRCVS